MKIGRGMLKALVNFLDSGSKRRAKKVPFSSQKENKYDIPYIDDGKELHKFDIYYAKDNRLNKTILDIHGGAYVKGSRKNQFYYAQVFKSKGYDVLVNDYDLVSEKTNRSVEDEIKDCVSMLNYLDSHLTELNLSNELYLTGDSAGGHFALLLAEMFNNETLSLRFGLNIKNLKLKCVLVNCPVYDFEKASKVKSFSDSARKYLFGKISIKDDWARMLSPKEYIKDINVPIFVSSAKNDFLLNESISLNDDLNKFGYEHEYEYIDSPNKKVSHVHNVIYLDLEESKYINDKMLDFMEKY